MTRTVFMTGATGLLGQYVLRQLLFRYVPVVALVRGDSSQNARERIDSILAQHEDMLGRTLPRPVVMEGDLFENRLGLSPADVRYLGQNCDSVIHSAASICFYATPDGEPFRSNVTGTSNLLSLGSHANFRDFHHVSTAYVCGRRTGQILETDLDDRSGFGNDYEKSKFEAEQLLRERLSVAALTVYRPSIIVGDISTGFTSTYHGFYTPLQLGVSLAKQFGFQEGASDWFLSEMGLEGNERKNLVPVDWVAAAIVRIWEAPELHGKTYHLTNPHPVRTQTLNRVITESARAAAASVPNVARDRTAVPSTFEFRKAMDTYRSYLKDDPQFDCHNTVGALPELPCPQLDFAALMQLSKFAVDRNFGWPKAPPARPSLDLERRLQAVMTSGPPEAASAEPFAYVLQVSGLGGGAWRVSHGDDRTLRTRPVSQSDWDALPGIYTTSSTVESLIKGDCDVATAIRTGRLTLFGERPELETARAELAWLIRLISEVPQTTPSPNGRTLSQQRSARTDRTEFAT